VKHIIESKPYSPLPQVQSITVDEDSAGQRLDNYLMRHLKGVPKTHVYRIIRSGEVRINKGRVSADTRVQAGDVVRLPPVRISERVAEKAQAMAEQVASHVPPKAFPILVEDECFMAINKPAGVAVHGGSGVSFGVIEQLRMAYPKLHYLELVHRLDRETSGILLIAKRRSALKNLQDQFRERETGKTYLAMVLGQWPSNKRVLDKSLHKYLLPNGERRVKVVAKDDPDAMPSLTLVKLCTADTPKPAAPVAALGALGCSLLEVTIKTGRTHQIRVHLASEGMPILGDDKYGDFDCNKALARADQAVPLKRMFLHAWRFQCKHPLTGKRIALQADLPQELALFLAHAAPGVGPSTPPSLPTGAT
jgi:23S rRNA pseudouridine955/2504/2580 synthase